MSEPAVLFSVEGPTATITLNRPAAGNTIDMAMAQGLLQAAVRRDADPAIRLLTLTGKGKLFCGGGDVSGFAEAGENISAYLSEMAGVLHLAVSRLMRMPKPLLVLVNGPAAGAGLSLAIAGKVVIAARCAHFTAAYGSVGLTPDGGMSWMLPRYVGLRRAQEIIITNRRVSAEEAEDIGLVTRVVDDAALAGEGAKMAAQLASAATGEIDGAKALLVEGASSSLETQLERESRSIALAAGLAECREGIAAFGERRKPDFSSKV